LNHVSELAEVDASFRNDIKQAIEAMPASKLIGLTVIGFNPNGTSRLEVPITPSLTFDGRIVQGGIVGMLADYAGVSAATCTLEPGWSSSTTSFEVHNIAAARGERLIAIGKAIKVGATIGISRADVYAERNGQLSLVCIATTTCKPFQLPSETRTPSQASSDSK
jgi:uncharacterized protein (TIGR00369 family)